MALLPSKSVMYSLFFNAEHEHNPSKIYEEAFGVEPESVQMNKSITFAENPFLGFAAGRVDDLFARVQIIFGRIDFIVEAIEINDLNETDVNLAVPTEKAVHFLSQAMQRVAGRFHGVIRLAVNAGLMEEAPSVADAAQSIFDDIGVSYPVDELSDVSFQLNKKAQLIDGVIINRLLKYNVISWQKMFVRDMEHVPVSDVKNCKLLALDLNTVIDGSKYNEEKIQSVFTNIGKELLRIAQVGNPSALF